MPRFLLPSSSTIYFAEKCTRKINQPSWVRAIINLATSCFGFGCYLTTPSIQSGKENDKQQEITAEEEEFWIEHHWLRHWTISSTVSNPCFDVGARWYAPGGLTAPVHWLRFLYILSIRSTGLRDHIWTTLPVSDNKRTPRQRFCWHA